MSETDARRVWQRLEEAGDEMDAYITLANELEGFDANSATLRRDLDEWFETPGIDHAHQQFIMHFIRADPLHLPPSVFVVQDIVLDHVLYGLEPELASATYPAVAHWTAAHHYARFIVQVHNHAILHDDMWPWEGGTHSRRGTRRYVRPLYAVLIFFVLRWRRDPRNHYWFDEEDEEEHASVLERCLIWRSIEGHILGPACSSEEIFLMNLFGSRGNLEPEAGSFNAFLRYGITAAAELPHVVDWFVDQQERDDRERRRARYAPQRSQSSPSGSEDDVSAQEEDNYDDEAARMEFFSLYCNGVPHSCAGASSYVIMRTVR